MFVFAPLIALLVSFNLYAGQPANACDIHLKPYADFSYERFADVQRQKAQQQGAQLPEFTDPKIEKQSQQTWQGIETPELFKKLLPEGVTFVSHSLRKADAGFVKSAGTGDAVILRVTMPYKNRTYSTNVAVPVSSLIDNLNRKDKWLVGPEAAACIDWGHGGGTKDTGEHTAFGPLNFFLKYGVVVMGQAQPWHSEGDRDFTETPEEYLTELRQEFLKRFVHPDVPVFGVGHSLGGLYTDMQWRRLGKDSRYKGFVSLSGVPDNCPGCGPDDKLRAELELENKHKLPEYNQRLAPGDKILGVELVRQLKISALSMFFTQFTELAHDWNRLLPEEQRVPILYIWGEGDFLYVGNEDRIRDLRQLKNVDVVTYGPRVDFAGKVENVGHLIFDHWRTLQDSSAAVTVIRNFLNLTGSLSLAEVKAVFKDKVLKSHVHRDTFLSRENDSADALLMAGYYYHPEFREFIDALIKKDYKGVRKDFFHQFVEKENPETFVLVREMMEKTLQKKMIERKSFSPAVDANTMLVNLAYRYANDLVAREVYQGIEIKDIEKKSVKGADGQERIPLDRLNERVKVLDETLNAISSLAKQKKNKKISEEEEKQKIDEILLQAKVKLKAPEGKRLNIEWTVEALTKQRHALYGILSRQYVFPGSRSRQVEENVKQRTELKKQLTALNSEKKKLSKDLKELTRKLSDKEKRFEKLLDDPQLHKDAHLSAVQQLNAQLKQQLDRLMAVDLEVRQGNSAYLQKLFAEQKLNRENLNNLPPELVALYARYTQETKAYQELKTKMVTQIKSMSAEGQLGLEWQTLHSDVWGEQGLIEQLQKLQDAILKLDLAMESNRVTTEALIEEYVGQLVPGFFRVRILAGKDLLSFSYDQSGYKALQTLAEKIQAITNTILKDMPPAGATELY